MNRFLLGFIAILFLAGCATRDLTPEEKQQRKAELIARCKQLKKDVDDLKGQPLQRNAAIKYYESECLARSDAAYYE